MSTRRGIHGFTLVETILAIGLLSFAAVMSSRTLLDSTRSIHRLRYQLKSSSLVEMVFQQYAAYAATNYQLLGVYNVTNQQPKDFFNRPDNFGYDGLLITTLATYSANKSSCTVAVALSWQDGGTPKVSSYVKTFVQTSQLGNGAAMQVWLKSPCAGGTDQDSIIANCPGIAGVVVSAPANNSGNTVVGTTDAQGQVLLKQVSLGSGVLVQVTAPSLADFTDANAAPSYYAQDAGGIYVSMLSKSVSLTNSNLNTLVVTDFKPTGQITGQVINDDTLIPQPPVDGMVVGLAAGTMVASNGTFQPCSASVRCVVTTDGNGKYVFNNVIPVPLTIGGAARPGSGLMVQQSDPSFSWGYTSAQAETIASSDWTHPSSQNSSTGGPVVTPPPFHLQRLGWAIINVTNQFTNAPLPNITLSTWISPFALKSESLYNSPSGVSDSSGRVMIYNVFSVDSVQITLSGARLPQGGDYGFYGQSLMLNLHHCVGQGTTVSYPMLPGYQLTGQIIDDNPANGIPGMQLSQGIPISPWRITANLSSDGHFSIQGFIPNSDAATPIVQTLSLGNMGLVVSDTLVGHTVDINTGLPAPHTVLGINGYQTGSNFTTDAAGYFNITSTFAYAGAPLVELACNDTTFQCVICPVGLPCSVASGGLPVHIDTRQNTLVINFPSDAHGYAYPQTYESLVQGVPLSITLPCTLHDYAVQGLTQDMSSHPIAGISVLDSVSVAVGTSADGTQGTTYGAYNGWAHVDGRTASNAGTVSLSVAAQAGYMAASVGPIALPDPIDPAVPIQQNVQLLSSGGGSNGGI